MNKSFIIGGTIGLVCGIGLVELKNVILKGIVMNYSKRNDKRVDSYFEPVIFENKDEAQEVRGNLLNLIEDYGLVTLADFKDLIGITSSFKDNTYGWTNLNKAYISKVKRGYILNLPKTKPIN